MEREQDHPYAFVPVDYGLVDRTFISMEPDWQEQYHNTPGITLVIQGEPSFFRGGCSYLELSTRSGNGHLYYGDHPNGLVHYYSHSGKEGRNEGGFGGATFPTAIRGGKFKSLRGPWSSRAACICVAVGQRPEHMIDDITIRSIDNGRGTRTSIGIKTQVLAYLAKKFQFPYYILREKRKGAEQGAWAISMEPDKIIKPNGLDVTQRHLGEYGFDILYDPKDVPGVDQID